MGQYRTHVFVCTSGETCPTQGDVEQFVKYLRGEAARAGLKDAVRIGVQVLEDIFASHIVGGKPVERLRYEPGVKGANKKKGAK